MGETEQVPQRRARPGPRRAAGLPAGRDEVVRAVLDAAAALFARDGVRETSLRAIAREAQVNAGLISRYVGTKDQLVEAVLVDLTEQVAAYAIEHPLEPHGFDWDSTTGRWVKMLLHYVTKGPGMPSPDAFNPVTAIARVVQDQYGLDERSARVRGAQVVGSALGWRIFEPYLVTCGSLDDVPLEELRLELTAAHRLLGATPVPAPTPRRRSTTPPD
ncbi:MAG: TetR/AcrR family transcriptional regulator [Acidimicrobiia bacterium]|nr:TetR/AcrR family transcriptional regulator [Acidimicrobiia bacterium]